MNLIETNHQINVTSDRSVSRNNHQINMISDHSVSSNDPFKRHLNAKSFKMFLTLSTAILLQCLLQGRCECIMGMLIQLQEKTEKNPHHYQYHQNIIENNRIIENKWDVKYFQILPPPTEGATENIGESLH